MLTCRLNVWDTGKNALEAFDTYRNLDFSYRKPCVKAPGFRHGDETHLAILIAVKSLVSTSDSQ
ncbi:hypothetical protein, partial [Aerosakkonema funiforme]